MTSILKKSLWLCFLLFLSLQASCAHGEAPHQPYQEEILDFYSTQKTYGEFSNFALFPVFVDNSWWPTTEHYYQAHKYDREDLIKWVKEAPSPMEAALRGRDKRFPKRSDWEEQKDSIMEKAVQDKFARYPSLQKLLLSTGTARIYEHTKNDCYWGDCGDRTGKNKLGLLLEKVRASLKASGENNSTKN